MSSSETLLPGAKIPCLFTFGRITIVVLNVEFPIRGLVSIKLSTSSVRVILDILSK